MFVPMAENLLHWTEKDISYFYSAAGVEVCVVFSVCCIMIISNGLSILQIVVAFVFVGLVSRKLGDRWQMLMGLACDILAYGWLLGLVGNATDSKL